MTSARHHARRASAPRLQAQRGIILILTLVALVLLLIGVVAIIRTVDTATAVIGNLSFRRDLTNRAEVAIAAAKATLNSGGAIYTESARSSDSPTNNYSSLALPNATGIGVPLKLLNSNVYANAGYQCMPVGCNPGSDGIVMRWIIDRQCSGTPGTPLTFTTSACAYLPNAKDKSGTASLNPLKPNGSARSVFRISVRVTGPRSTEAYIQTTAG